MNVLILSFIRYSQSTPPSFLDWEPGRLDIISTRTKDGRLPKRSLNYGGLMLRKMVLTYVHSRSLILVIPRVRYYPVKNLKLYVDSVPSMILSSLPMRYIRRTFTWIQRNSSRQGRLQLKHLAVRISNLLASIQRRKV